MADKEYIERAAALAEIGVRLSRVKRNPYDNKKETMGAEHALRSVIDGVKACPAADVVEIVRCKDCIWFDPRYLDEDGTFWCEHTGFGRVTRYDYCSHGARKKG